MPGKIQTDTTRMVFIPIQLRCTRRCARITLASSGFWSNEARVWTFATLSIMAHRSVGRSTAKNLKSRNIFGREAPRGEEPEGHGDLAVLSAPAIRQGSRDSREALRYN